MRREEEGRGRRKRRKGGRKEGKARTIIIRVRKNGHHSIFHTNTHSSYLETTHGVKKQDLQERLQDGAELARDPVHDLSA